jgi:hypothetical protein
MDAGVLSLDTGAAAAVAEAADSDERPTLARLRVAGALRSLRRVAGAASHAGATRAPRTRSMPRPVSSDAKSGMRRHLLLRL